MKRTITVKDSGYIYYGNRHLGFLVTDIQHRFRLERKGKYIVTLTEGTQFKFYARKDNFYSLYEKGRRVGIVCASRFSRLFFKPDNQKRYDITIKHIKTKKKK